MDKQNIAELNILQEIDSDGHCTQRELARRSGLTLSYLNIYLKGLIRKGYVSVRDMPGRRLWYNLTPVGMAEKAKMTLEYMKWSLAKYQNIRDRVRGVCQKLKQENKLNIAICGVSDAAEIFYLATIEAGLRVVGVVDDSRAGQKWLNFPVMKVSSLKNKIPYDFIIIGDIDHCYELAQQLSDLSISDEKYQVCTGQRIKAVTVVQVVD
ncbi:MAG: winged helix-turn-helix transcriptional regulator [Deltaproteobacteria bacterium]|nr:winged helix-turn-helix transcriptional regulator [Deltaproteobacteria bacterium]MBW2075261.1 winged helix-turn-helix transcriptional regulator [Deltaproteobacteria bacterium]